MPNWKKSFGKPIKPTFFRLLNTIKYLCQISPTVLYSGDYGTRIFN
nr:MAG TPA_asm: hypothetical protein [Caudoviricetes sp.]